MTTDREQSRLNSVDRWGISRDGPNDFSGDDASMSLIQRISTQARLHPDTPALSMNEQTLDYASVNARANQLAWRLRSVGIGPESVVGVCLDRSPEFVIALLGVLKAGAAYLPLDPAYPEARKQFMLRDAGALTVVTSQEYAPQFALSGLPLVRIDIDAATLAANSPEDPPVVTTPDHLAYVIYTSGSTGQPKGVEITHASVSNLIAWHYHAFALTSADRVTHLAGLAFDAVGWELWPALACGATIFLPSERVRTDPIALQEWLVAHQITVSFVPTVLAEHLVRQSWPPETVLRVLLTGAEALRQYPRADLPFALVNNYGPTEATVVATSGEIFPNDHPTMPPPIGRPILNAEILLLDEQLRPVPDGEPGELYIGGAGLARGYRGQPELTAQRFVAHPFRPGARLYRTGDLARLLPDGQLAFIGRNDDQIKLRGYRIEPGEIEQALHAHPAVRQSLVVASSDDGKEPRLIAYMILASDATLTTRDAQTFLRTRLPDYMIPTAVVTLPAFPLTPNGKVDRAALPMPELTATSMDGDAPATIVEERLCAILSELLKISPVNVTDNFFLLGGHSLLGTQVIARVADMFGVELSLRALFDAPTVRQLASVVEERVFQIIAAQEQV